MPKTRNISNEDRAIKALNLRAQGATYEQIAERLGYSGKGAVHNVVSKLLSERKAEGVEELRAQGQIRYETVIREMTIILSERRKETVVTDSGVSERMVPTYGVDERANAARTIIRAQDSLNRLFGLNMEQPVGTSNNQLLIVEAEVLSNNMQEALLPNPQPVELGEIVDVVVDDE